MSMNIQARIQLLAASTLIGVAIAPAAAQSYPTKPARAVLPFSAGSGPDAAMRQIGEILSRDWGQQVLIDNKPGGNAWIAAGEVKRATADGHTLLAVDAPPMTLQPHLYKHTPFDPVGDFEPIAALYSTNFFIVVNANSPCKSVSDLLAAARRRAVA
jgi:tripartite-type tricarboxylate transporter receptor subunit TctC